MPITVRLSPSTSSGPAHDVSLLAHLAFNAPLVSRDKRVKAFLNRNQGFLGHFKGRAREILELLVDKYRAWRASKRLPNPRSSACGP
jgi:hypothetical protein